MMTITKIVFSPTGGTDRVADILARALGDQVVTVDLCDRNTDFSKVEMGDLAVIAGIEAVAEHSIVRDFAKGRPDESDDAQLRLFAAQINNKLISVTRSELTLPGNRPYKEYKCGGMVPVADDNCINCGKCAQACPTGAIAMDDLKHADATLCMSCMRCIAVCPVNARAIDAERYEGLKAHLKDVCSVRKEAVLYI